METCFLITPDDLREMLLQWGHAADGVETGRAFVSWCGNPPLQWGHAADGVETG